jgi:beta-galactosidase
MNIKIKTLALFSLAIILLTGCNGTNEASDSLRYTKSLNDDWLFKLGDDSAYSEVSYNANSWRKLDVPHDWSVEGTYDTIHGTDWQTGYLPAGIGWYRKEINLDKDPKDHTIELQFDGVYMNSTVWVNDELIGTHHYGYTTFFYDISDYLKKGKNTIAVRVDNSKPNSARWYTGAGIYRNVWLRVMPKAYFKTNEQFVKASFSNDNSVSLHTEAEFVNKDHQELKGTHIQKIFNEDLKLLTTEKEKFVLSSNDNVSFDRKISLEQPELWSLENPRRHIVVNQVVDENERLIDSDTTYFGIRKTEFSPEWGFKLNDENIKIKGVCLHQDAGLYGVAVPESILAYRLNLLKEMGVNAIRTSHNPFSPEFYSMCDTLGILVLDEIFDGWEKTKATDDYGLYFEDHWETDVSYWVKNNRNHPSVFMYSIGNEVPRPNPDTQKMLIDFVKNIDDSRPITQGGFDPTRGMKEELKINQLDIKGFNGDGEEMGRFEAFHEEFPNIPIIGTEVPHTYQTRGVYRTQTHWRRKHFPAKWEINDNTAGTMKGLEGKLFPLPDLADEEVFPEEKTIYYKKFDSLIPIDNPNPWKENLYYQSSYDNATVRTSARKAWQIVEELEYLMGEFRWTGFDYLGETNQWPSRYANFGVIDIANLPKDHFYLYQSLWTESPMVHMLPHWTHPGKDGVEIPVVVYTNTDAVELFLNETSLGKKEYEGEQLKWMVPYTEGEIKAKAYKNGKVVAEESYKTAEGDKKLKVTSAKDVLSSENKENTLVFIDLVDDKGSLFPLADDYITVEVSGAGKLRGLDNGDPIDLTPYTSNSKRAFRGKLVAFVEAETKGSIDVKVYKNDQLVEELRIEAK